MPRYSSWLAIGLAAAFLVVASVAFSAPTTAWLAFSIGVATLVMSIGIGAAYLHQIGTAVVALITAGVSAWMIVASLVFSSGTAQTLAFAEALAICGLALVGLTVHEVGVERAAHAGERGSDAGGTRLAPAA
jgi:hypothetical protein